MQTIFNNYISFRSNYFDEIKRDRSMCFIYADLKEIESRIRFGILYELACEHFENGEYFFKQILQPSQFTKTFKDKMESGNVLFTR